MRVYLGFAMLVVAQTCREPAIFEKITRARLTGLNCLDFPYPGVECVTSQQVINLCEGGRPQKDEADIFIGVERDSRQTLPLQGRCICARDCHPQPSGWLCMSLLGACASTHLLCLTSSCPSHLTETVQHRRATSAGGKTQILGSFRHGRGVCTCERAHLRLAGALL